MMSALQQQQQHRRKKRAKRKQAPFQTQLLDKIEQHDFKKMKQLCVPYYKYAYFLSMNTSKKKKI